MQSFCEEVKALIGEQLRAAGAVHIKNTQSGSGLDEKEVCFFAASGKVIAITYSPRDGESCFVGDSGADESTMYETWDSLWHLLGHDKDLDFNNLDSVVEYIRSFPKGHQDAIRYIGDCLVEYLDGVR